MILLKIGLIGCGRISDIYRKNCAAFESLESTACASLDIDESMAKAAQHGPAPSMPPLRRMPKGRRASTSDDPGQPNTSHEAKRSIFQMAMPCLSLDPRHRFS